MLRLLTVSDMSITTDVNLLSSHLRIHTRCAYNLSSDEFLSQVVLLLMVLTLLSRNLMFAGLLMA